MANQTVTINGRKDTMVIDVARMEQLLMSDVVATLAALSELGGEGIETGMYIALDNDMKRWELLRHVLLQAGLVTIQSHVVTLTPKGKSIASELSKLLEKGDVK